MSDRVFLRIISIILLLAIMTSLICSCESNDTPEITQGETATTDAPSTDTTSTETETETVAETETDTETETETETTVIETTETETTTAETTAAETTAPVTMPVISGPQPQNPLTGLQSDKSFDGQRPVAIMINNLSAALPQVGIAKADIMYECIVEGGITRLMMVVADYASLGVIGSIRSCRDYYLDYAADTDSIYVHAGGSTEGYNQIIIRKVDNLDGVNQNNPGMFYRDATRRLTMAIEHTLMTTGEGIVGGIAYRKLRTSLKENFVSSYQFAEWGTEVKLANKAEHAHIFYSAGQIVDFVYDSALNKYLRYQYGGKPHIDGETGEQLAYTNLLVLFTECNVIPGDAYGHYELKTLDKGTGYYIYGGKAKAIKWKRETRSSPIQLTYTSGDPVLLNRGNTFVSVAPTSGKSYFSLNYQW